ncbi:MAG: hypothetical protein NTY23_11570, partial [Chloroflexi bacterium]|nr:hypothetical protein [Chloroflexota bacterium]
MPSGAQLEAGRKYAGQLLASAKLKLDSVYFDEGVRRIALFGAVVSFGSAFATALVMHQSLLSVFSNWLAWAMFIAYSGLGYFFGQASDSKASWATAPAARSAAIVAVAGARLQKWRAALPSRKTVGLSLVVVLVLTTVGAALYYIGSSELDWRCRFGGAKRCEEIGLGLAGTTPVRANRAFDVACNRGLVTSCLTLGGRLFDGQEYAAAVAPYTRACDGGNATGCYNLGLLYYDGHGVTQDQGRAATLFQRACDGSSIEACYNIGAQYYSGLGVVQDYGRAATLLQRACDGENVAACFYVGLLHYNGQGVPQDVGCAAPLFQKACDGQNTDACYYLGGMYEEGRGVVRNHGRAATVYQRACDGGNNEACNNLGVLYHEGRGVGKDFGRAAALFQRACDGGNSISCDNLGAMYENGDGGMEPDAERALELYRRACEGRNPRRPPQIPPPVAGSNSPTLEWRDEGC